MDSPLKLTDLPQTSAIQFLLYVYIAKYVPKGFPRAVGRPLDMMGERGAIPMGCPPGIPHGDLTPNPKNLNPKPSILHTKPANGHL